MKKSTFSRYPIRWAICGVVFILAVIAMLYLFVWRKPPGSGTPSATVRARAFPDGRVLELSVHCTLNPGDYPAYGAHTFQPSLSFEKLKEQLWENFDGEIVEYDTLGLLLRQKNEDGTYSHYLLECLDAKTFLFYGMAATINRGQGIGSEWEDTLLLPFHYIADERISHKLAPRLYEGAEYQLVPNRRLDKVDDAEVLLELQQKFFAFYQDTPYQPQLADKGLMLTIDGKSWMITFCTHCGQAFFSVESIHQTT